jgi:hypothetical protein
MYGYGYGAFRHGMMGSSGGGAFSPTDLSGLKLWVDASDFVSDGAISQWNDKSGLNNHLLQPTGVNQPSVVLAQKNSMPIVRFGVLSYMDLTATISATTARTELFLVKKADGDRACALSDNNIYYATYLSSTTFYSATGNVYQEASGVTANYDVIMHTRTGDTIKLYRNGVLLSSSTSSFSRTENTLTIFGRLSAGSPSIFDCAEHLFYNRVLTTQELADIQTYLATKWSL